MPSDPVPASIRHPAPSLPRASQARSQGFRGLVRAAGLAAALALPAGAPVLAETSVTDLSWAQQVLREKGYRVDRRDGVMSPRTAEALRAFQRSAGLPVTGTLDAATIEKLLEGRPVAPTMGNLATQVPGASRAGRPAAVPPAPPAAVPVQSVDVVSPPPADSAIADVTRGRGAFPDSPEGRPHLDPGPGAAPRGTVETAGGGMPAVPAVPTAPPWVHRALVAVLALTLGSAGLLWWRSGRSNRRRHVPRGAASYRDPATGPVFESERLRRS